MVSFPFLAALSCLISGALFWSGCRVADEKLPEETLNVAAGPIRLPPPDHDSNVSLEKALYTRVSRRNFSNLPLALDTAGQILWAAQGVNIDGVTGATRTAPSAGATHPMDIYLVAGNVESLSPGLYRYEHEAHSLRPVLEGDIREDVARAALEQQFIAQAPAIIILAVEYGRTTQRYGERGIRYAHMEAGHITQNVYLQAETLGLATVAIGAFIDEQLKSLMGIDSEPLMIMPVGHVE